MVIRKKQPIVQIKLSFLLSQGWKYNICSHIVEYVFGLPPVSWHTTPKILGISDVIVFFCMPVSRPTGSFRMGADSLKDQGRIRGFGTISLVLQPSRRVEGCQSPVARDVIYLCSEGQGSELTEGSQRV